MGSGVQDCQNGPSVKDVRAREIQTKTLWNAHSTQRHRGAETRGKD
jgi:hypothetical protein